MFGNEYDIVRQFPNYFLDYRAELDPAIRWTDRVFSSSGDWSGNIFDFYFRVYNKLKQSLTVPFKLSGVTRIDDTAHGTKLFVKRSPTVWSTPITSAPEALS